MKEGEGQIVSGTEDNNVIENIDPRSQITNEQVLSNETIDIIEDQIESDVDNLNQTVVEGDHTLVQSNIQFQQQFEHGDQLLAYDENGQPILQYDENGQLLPGYDQNAMYQYEQQYNDNDQIPQYYEGHNEAHQQQYGEYHASQPYQTDNEHVTGEEEQVYIKQYNEDCQPPNTGEEGEIHMRQVEHGEEQLFQENSNIANTVSGEN
ncbi:hypothetical protein JTB14_007612 [Gonioctena quinquepunctata]|nr:hypothetical protein JTB14_007612 [Gonioctena quinquepunctata]